MSDWGSVLRHVVFYSDNVFREVDFQVLNVQEQTPCFECPLVLYYCCAFILLLQKDQDHLKYHKTYL